MPNRTGSLVNSSVAPKLPFAILHRGPVPTKWTCKDAAGNILETSRDLRNVLLAKGYKVDYREFPGDHDYINWRGTIADAL